MSGVNKAILIGNLGADPEVRYTSGNRAVTSFRLATNEVWTDGEGQRKESTEWHRVVLFGRVAEVARDYLRKGKQVYIEGRIQTREWTDRDGNRRFTTEIVGQQMTLLGGVDGGRGRGGYDEPPPPMGPEDYYAGSGGGDSSPRGAAGGGRPSGGRAGDDEAKEPAGAAKDADPGVVDDDDIPF